MTESIKKLTSIIFISSTGAFFDDQLRGTQEVTIYLSQRKMRQAFYFPEYRDGREAAFQVEQRFNEGKMEELRQLLIDAGCFDWHQATYPRSGPHWQVRMRTVTGADFTGYGSAPAGAGDLTSKLQGYFETSYPLVLFAGTAPSKEAQQWLKDSYNRTVGLEQRLLTYREVTEARFETYHKNVHKQEEYWDRYSQFEKRVPALDYLGEEDLDQYNFLSNFFAEYLVQNGDFSHDLLGNAYDFGFYNLCNYLDEDGVNFVTMSLYLKDVGKNLKVTDGLIDPEDMPAFLEAMENGYLDHCHLFQHPPYLNDEEKPQVKDYLKLRELLGEVPATPVARHSQEVGGSKGQVINIQDYHKKKKKKKRKR